MTKHTPGPWAMEKDGRVKAVSRIERQTFGIFSGIASDASQIDEHLANCRLIAAAPELLVGLKDLFAMIDDQVLVRNIDDDARPDFHLRAMKTVGRLKAAHDAILKAEGRS